MSVPPEALIVSKGLAVGGWLIALFVLERTWPSAPRDRLEGTGTRPGYLRRLGDPARLLRNGAFWIINAGGSSLIVVPVTVWAGAHVIGVRPAWLGGPLGLALDLLLLDVWIYWWHRANHELPWLWRFHGVHHLDRFLDSTSAGRFHLGEVVLSAFARTVPIVLLSIPVASVLVFETAVVMAAIFHHSNLSLPRRFERVLARLIITPSIHWVHHHAKRRDTNSNYGTILSIWDPMFGTRNRSRREPDMTIGVEGEHEETLVGLLLRPLSARPR